MPYRRERMRAHPVSARRCMYEPGRLVQVWLPWRVDGRHLPTRYDGGSMHSTIYDFIVMFLWLLSVFTNLLIYCKNTLIILDWLVKIDMDMINYLLNLIYTCTPVEKGQSLLCRSKATSNQFSWNTQMQTFTFVQCNSFHYLFVLSRPPRVDVNECLVADACLNGGTCRNLMGTFICDCPVGWQGDR